MQAQWIDEIVKQVLKRKPVAIISSGKTGYLVSDWKTPSGHIHIGSLRGALIHDEIFKALKARKKPVKYIYGFDDFDAMDKMPKYLPKSFEKYMGMPFSKIPAPKGNGKYGDYYATEFQKVYEKMGIESQTLWTSKLYKTGKFNCAFDIVIANADKIRALYKKISSQDRPKDWLPVQMICEKCGKIGTTRAFDFKDKKVHYICDRNYVRYTKGCGYEGAKSPYNGNAKLPWKVEWAAKWFIFGTSVEGAGKDHQTKGGSHDLASAIMEEVFQGKTPVNIFYEFFLLEGKKMSTSKAVGLGASELIENIAPSVARFMILKNKPESQFNLNLDGDAIPRLYDSWDQTLKGFHFRFSKVAFILQMPHIDLEKEAQTEKGSALTKMEKDELKERIDYAKIWLTRFADASQKYKLLPVAPKVKLTAQQKDFLAELAVVFESRKNWTGDALHTQIHKIKDKVQIAPKLAFSAIYQIFLGRDSGPQAGWFLTSLDRKFVERRLRQIAE